METIYLNGPLACDADTCFDFGPVAYEVKVRPGAIDATWPEGFTVWEQVCEDCLSESPDEYEVAARLEPAPNPAADDRLWLVEALYEGDPQWHALVCDAPPEDRAGLGLGPDEVWLTRDRAEFWARRATATSSTRDGIPPEGRKVVATRLLSTAKPQPPAWQVEATFGLDGQ